MTFFTEAELRAAARRVTTTYKSAETTLRHSTEHLTYDIFLSHARLDADLVLGLKLTLERAGKTVYVDWIDDKHLSRDHVTPATAQVLQRRMRQSRSLIYATSTRSRGSVWMPWELGFFDGVKGPESIAILPLEGGTNYPGHEFVGLYPLAEKDHTFGTTVPRVVITRQELSRRRAKSLDSLVAGIDDYRLVMR